MAKKKNKFGWDDFAELAGHAATMVGHFKNAQDAAKKSFEDGNKTNLEAAQGGKSPRLKANTSKNIDQSPLAREYNRKNYMY